MHEIHFTSPKKATGKLCERNFKGARPSHMLEMLWIFMGKSRKSYRAVDFGAEYVHVFLKKFMYGI